MVELMIMDIFGNDNRCMIFVFVIDKVDFDCMLFDDIVVICSFLV